MVHPGVAHGRVVAAARGDEVDHHGDGLVGRHHRRALEGDNPSVGRRRVVDVAGPGRHLAVRLRPAQQTAVGVVVDDPDRCLAVAQVLHGQAAVPGAGPPQDVAVLEHQGQDDGLGALPHGAVTHGLQASGRRLVDHGGQVAAPRRPAGADKGGGRRATLATGRQRVPDGDAVGRQAIGIGPALQAVIHGEIRGRHIAAAPGRVLERNASRPGIVVAHQQRLEAGRSTGRKAFVRHERLGHAVAVAVAPLVGDGGQRLAVGAVHPGPPHKGSGQGAAGVGGQPWVLGSRWVSEAASQTADSQMTAGWPKAKRLVLLSRLRHTERALFLIPGLLAACD